MSSPNLIDDLKWRYAVKKFDPSQKIPDAHWKTLLESVRLAASSFGLQPFRLLEIKDRELRKKLRTVSWDQSQITDADRMLVFTHLRATDSTHIQKYVTHWANTRGVTVESLSGYRQGMLSALESKQKDGTLSDWAARQAYLALGTALAAAAVMRIDACPMEGLDKQAYATLLALNPNYEVTCVATFGVRSSLDEYQRAAKVRFPLDEIYEIR